jgi:hypothetical protein
MKTLNLNFINIFFSSILTNHKIVNAVNISWTETTKYPVYSDFIWHNYYNASVVQMVYVSESDVEKSVVAKCWWQPTQGLVGSFITGRWAQGWLFSVCTNAEAYSLPQQASAAESRFVFMERQHNT